MLGPSGKPSCLSWRGRRVNVLKHPGKMFIFELEAYLRPSGAMWRHLGGHLGGILGYVGVSWEDRGPCWGHFGSPFAVSWGILGGLRWRESVQTPRENTHFRRHGHLRPCGSILGAILGYVGVFCGYLRPSWGHLGGGHLGLSWGYLGPVWEQLWGEGWLQTCSEHEGKYTFSRLRGIFGHPRLCRGVLGAILGVAWAMLGYLGPSWRYYGVSYQLTRFPFPCKDRFMLGFWGVKSVEKPRENARFRA